MRTIYLLFALILVGLGVFLGTKYVSGSKLEKIITGGDDNQTNVSNTTDTPSTGTRNSSRRATDSIIYLTHDEKSTIDLLKNLHHLSVISPPSISKEICGQEILLKSHQDRGQDLFGTHRGTLLQITM